MDNPIPSRPADLPHGGWTEAAVRVLTERYTLKDEAGRNLETPDDVMWRVAYTIAAVDRTFGAPDEHVMRTARRFYELMVRGQFMPNSPTLMNAGTPNGLQWGACFVLPIEDDLSAIFMAMHNAALIHQAAGGTGFAFSRLRPKNSRVRTTSGVSSGPVSFLRVYDAATEHVKQGASRRGANMAILRVDHPDILEFVNCKRDGGITNFNISVAITDAFMRALEDGTKYELLAQPGWPLPGGGRAQGGGVLGALDAKEVWQGICRAAWATGDPGLFFVDRVNRSAANAAPTLQQIETTNPCGEQNLPPHGACTLGHLNLAAFVHHAQIDWDALATGAHDSVRFLDNVVEANPYTLPAIREQALNERRIGLGVMGWADLLFALGIPYASEEAVQLARQLGQFVLTAAQQASHALAVERGSFPWFARSIYKGGPPRRNSNLTTVAPTGTVSIFAGCSSGIEPLFALAFQHRVRQPDKSTRVLTFVNAAVRQALSARGLDTPEILGALERQGTLHDIPGIPEDLKILFATAHEVPVEWHVQHQAAWQTSFSESSVSKTINLPNAATVEDVARAYRLAWDTGCLGITVFRDGCKGEQVLHVGASRHAATPAETPPATDLVPLVEPRPRRVKGETWEIQSPLGEVYVTLNVTVEDEPFEIFVRVGKSGTDIEAFAEALGRLMSNFLRYNRLPDRRTRLAKIVKQLSGIGGSGHVGFGANRIRSVPDAIARAISEFLAPEEAEQLGLVSGGGAKHFEALTPVGDMCPKCGNATFVYEEGCKKCHSCLHSEC
ncbi:MAG: adenosylcobalamin-dependent ribonucleoside-diphosphate reductase [Candidatus Rokuibacteriota bacterium]